MGRRYLRALWACSPLDIFGLNSLGGALIVPIFSILVLSVLEENQIVVDTPIQGGIALGVFTVLMSLADASAYAKDLGADGVRRLNFYGFNSADYFLPPPWLLPSPQ